jgi:hypothetical protein
MSLVIARMFLVIMRTSLIIIRTHPCIGGKGGRLIGTAARLRPSTKQWLRQTMRLVGRAGLCRVRPARD